MKQTHNQEFRGVLALLALAGIYGFIGYFSRELAPGLSLWQQLYLRLFLALPFLWLTFYKRINLRNCLKLFRQEPGLIILRALCLYIMSIPLYFYAAQHAELGNVALLQVLPYTFVAGWLVNKEKLSLTKVALMLVALVGASLITLHSGLNLHNIGRGELASIASGALLSLGLVTRKKHRTTANDTEISLTLMFVGLVGTVIVSVFAGDRLPHTTIGHTRFMILLLVAAYLNSLIIFFANYGFRRVRDTLANNIMALEGAYGVVFGLILYNEIPGSHEVLGAAIILASAFASTYLIRSKPKTTSNP